MITSASECMPLAITLSPEAAANIALLASQGLVVRILPDGSLEARSPEETRSRAAQRQAAYRQRKASQTVTKHNGTSQTVTRDAAPLPPSPPPPQTPPPPHPPTPGHTAQAPASARTCEATPPDDLLLTAEPEPKPSKAKGTREQLAAYAVEIGLPSSDGEYLHDHWSANGWKTGKHAMRDWKAGMRTWKGQGWLPSQKQRGSYTNGRLQRQAYDSRTATAGLTPEQIGGKDGKF
jgi:hypothetical protein